MQSSHPALAALLALTWLGAAPVEAADFAAQWERIKREATPRELYTLLYALPKGGDLHNHLTGSYLPEQWWDAGTSSDLAGRASYYVRVRAGDFGEDLLPRYPLHTIRESKWAQLSPTARADYVPLAQLDAATKAAWLSNYQLDQPDEGRYTFFAAPGQRLLDMNEDPAIVIELLIANMKLYGAEGLRYLEYQATPFRFRRPDGSPIDPEEAAALYEAGLNRPDAKATGVEVRFLITAGRFAPDAEKQVELIYDFVSRHPQRWVGINMAGIEERGMGYPSRFLDTYRRLRRTHPHVQISIHAGEMDGPNSHVRDTLLLGATRIGHGVTLIKDPDTMLTLRHGRTLVEINLISNHLLEYTPDLDLHPFPEYLRFGIPVCLNTDDRGWWSSNMTDEYFVGVTRFNLAWHEIVKLAQNSLEFSFLDAPTKSRLLTEYAGDIAAFEKRFGGENWRAALGAVKPVTYGYAKRQFGLEFANGK